MSTVSIIGSGTMARTIATRALAAGTGVQLIGRDAAKAEALAAGLGGDVTTAPFGETPAGDVVILAVVYGSAAEVVGQYGAKLAGKAVVDISNPFDMETMTDLVTPPDSSGAQQIAAAAAPGVHVVKAFNTLFANVLADGTSDGRKVDVFIAGDDAEAKKKVSVFVESLGLRPLDAGELKMARWLEGMGLLALNLARKSENFALNFNVLG